jgi:aryl-alcohol dehydrogenase
MINITAAVLRKPATPFVLETITLDEPREDEVLVRLVATGVCHTDIVVSKVLPTTPAVLGHEGAGIVERVGSRVSKVRPGDHVVLSYVSCGKCKYCLQGKGGYCQSFELANFAGIRPDGSTTMRQGDEIVHGSFFGQSSFATYALATERNVVKVRTDAPLELLGPLGCGIQTGAGAVMNVFAPQAGQSVVVFGTGSVGLSAIMAARAVGCTTIIGVDIRPQRLAGSTLLLERAFITASAHRSHVWKASLRSTPC